MLAAGDFAGHVILEVTTSRARNAAERGTAPAVESLEFAREHLLAARDWSRSVVIDVLHRGDEPDAVTVDGPVARYDGFVNENWTIGPRWTGA